MPDLKQEAMAIIIASTCWPTQPDMSGDPWSRIDASRKRRAMDAATAILDEFKEFAVSDGAEITQLERQLRNVIAASMLFAMFPDATTRTALMDRIDSALAHLTPGEPK
jgi:hypothetical protein